MTRFASSTLALGALAGLLLASPAPAREKSKTTLTAPTATTAKGRAVVSIKNASNGRFEVRVQKLAGNTSYDLVVGGVKVATLTTTKGGAARATFASRPRGHDLLLGFDPRGDAVEVRNGAGVNVLTGNVPATGGGNDTDVTCCVPDGGGDGPAECEDRTVDECAAQGGTVVTATSCLPNPCSNTPPTNAAIVCCIPDDSGPECEDRMPAECLAAGGAVVEATSCTPNPCAATPPPSDDDVQCCIPDSNVYECEDRTISECAAAGGINKGPGDCSPNPCGDLLPPASRGLCCLPNAGGDEVECEDRTPTACAAAGGVSKGNGACAVDTCADVLPPNPDVRCCLPNPSGDELECEDRTAAQCAAAGGTNLGAGVCAANSCDALTPPEPEVQCCVADSHGAKRCEDRTEAKCAARGGTVVGTGVCPAFDPCS